MTLASIATPTNNTLPTFSGTVAGGVSAVTVYIYSGTGTGGTLVQTLTTTASGGSYSVPASSALANRTFTAEASQTDAAGGTGTSSTTTFVINTVTPTISNVTSTDAAGTYVEGQTIPITLTFSEAVTATGTPQLTLNTLPTNAVVNYASGSGTSTLTFNYVVGTGRPRALLDVASSAAGAERRHDPRCGRQQRQFDAARTGRTGSLEANKSIAVDTAPIITVPGAQAANGSTESPSPASPSPRPGFTSNQITLSAAHGAPTLSSTTGLTFDRSGPTTPQDGLHGHVDQHQDGAEQPRLQGHVRLQRTRYDHHHCQRPRDGARRAAASDANYSRDGDVDHFHWHRGDEHEFGDQSRLYAQYGGGGREHGNRRTDVRYHQHFDRIGHQHRHRRIKYLHRQCGCCRFQRHRPHGDLVRSGHACLASGNTITVTFPSSSQTAIQAYQVAGLVSTSPVDHSATATGDTSTPSSGATATLAQANEFVFGAVTSHDATSFTAGTNFTALATSNPSTRILATEYETVNATAGIAATGTLNATENWAAGVVTYKALVAPTVTGVSSTASSYSYNKAGGVIPITVAFTSAVTVTGTPQLTLNTNSTPNAVATYASGSGTSTLTFDYTVAAGQNSADLDYLSASALALNGGTITSGGIAATLTLPNTGIDGLAREEHCHRHHAPHGHRGPYQPQRSLRHERRLPRGRHRDRHLEQHLQRR